MKQNVKATKKVLCGANMNTGSSYYGEDYIGNVNCNKDDIFGLKTHKMKRSNKDAKLGDKYLKHLTLKSIRISFANLFKPSKRIGRNQENMFTETKKCTEVNRGQQQTPLSVNFVQAARTCSSTQVVKLSESQFKSINAFNELQDSSKKGLKRQLSELNNNFPLRSTVTVANICTLVNAPHVTNSAQLPGSSQRKVQPSMGLKVISVKTAKSKETKLQQISPDQQIRQRELVPFLDSIEKLVPVSSSTFIVNATKQHKGSTESVQSGSSTGSSESLTKITETNISPVSINSTTRNKRKQVRSISVMNVSSIMSNQF